MIRPDPRGPRCRWMVGPGRWEVQGRVERFAEPSILLLLREGPLHGYELRQRLVELALPEGGVDMGNLYRLLRGLEEEGIVASDWRGDLPGPARRTYRLTESGLRLLDRWADALRETQGTIAAFFERYKQSGRR